jgi:photosystem II stability/assembly factor-like uncharacterized protein
MKLVHLLGILLVSIVLVPAAFSQEKSAADEKGKTVSDKVDSGFLSALSFRSIGPALTSGRVGDIALDPNSPNTWYVAVGSGNIWKTTNAGTTFTPIFENYGSYSIGCITIDPNSSNTIWVGTGENVGGRHIGFGDGVYRSRDGGKSFENVGLKNSEHIGKIIVDPRDSNTVFVASQGPLWSSGGERGLFKSTDGGASWRNVLSKGPYTGVTDVVIDSENPDVMYAATHQRHRTVWALLNTGPESGVHKSIDGGETWRELGGGLPGGDKGKIALGISPQKNNVIYATVETVNRKGGFFRSEDFGESWTQMSDFLSGGTGPHYYQEIYLDPHRFDVIYHANNTLVRSIDGGRNFVPVEGGTKHVDNHAVVFHPNDPDFVLVGCDGGVYRSDDFCKSYRFFPNLPVTQFYKVDVDYDTPFYHVVGGTQDNFSLYGPIATRNVQGITNEDWRVTIGGDGHDNAINPTNPDIIYCESQEGYIRRYDRRTGESVDVRPQPGAGEEGLRFNWDSPILISPHNPARVYFASRFLHRSDDHGESWKKISPDLSRGKDRWRLPIMGRVWGIDAGFDLMAMSMYGNITSISESPVVEGLIYVGTDDGLIQVTEDGGANWRKIEKIYDVPENAFVNDIKADRHDANTVYVCLDNHKTGDYKSYVLKSTDRGKTWTSIVSNLPERHLVWRLEQDHVRPELLFLGTEFGCFVSLNAGQKWIKLNSGLPTIPVRDLAIQKRENDLVCATFGRGFYVLDNYSPLRELTTEKLDRAAHLFPVRDALWYQQADRIGGRKGFQGDTYFTSDNPTYGATFSYYLKDGFKSKKDARKEKEATAKQSGSDAPVATFEELEAEKNEVLPLHYLQITDSSGNFVNRIELPNSAGLHRVSWDFRFAPMGMPGFGTLAAPGEYRVTLCKLMDDKVEKLTDEIKFIVKSIVTPSLPAADFNEVVQFQKKLFAAQGRIFEINKHLGDSAEILSAARQTVKSASTDPSELLKKIREAALELQAFQKQLNGDGEKSERRYEEVPSIGGRLSNVLFSVASSTHGPTKTHREQFEIAERELNEVAPKIESFKTKVEALKAALKSAGLPLVTGGLTQPKGND